MKAHHAKEVLEYVRTANKSRGGMVTAGRIQSHLLQKFNKLFKKCTIYYCLKKRLGLRYANAGKPKPVFTAARKCSAIVFCKNYDEALKLQRAGTHIIVYIDESYCHDNRAISRTWNEDGVIPNRPRGKGALMIIVHAMTRDGFLLPPGELYDVGKWKCGPVPTAEMIFRAKYANKNRVPDYRDTMDSEFFVYWVKNRLVPAFENRYLGKKIILVCDNAPYHHSMGDDGFTPNSLSKTEIVEKLGLLPRK